MSRRVEGNRPSRQSERPEDIRAIVEQTPLVREAVKRRETLRRER